MTKTKEEDKTPNLIIRAEFERIFNDVTDAERGKLLSALMAYRWHGELPSKLPDRLYGIFLTLKTFADIDAENYKKKCEENQKNIQAYWDKVKGKEK